MTVPLKGKYKNQTSGMRNDYLNIGILPRGGKLIRTEKLLITWLSLILSFSYFSALAQPGIKSFNDLNAATFSKSLPDERVLINTDREIYLCGESIVFEAFIYDGNWFLPVIMSSVLYVEFYNQDNLVISRGKYFMKNGRCSGTISIPRDISSNIYYIRAYTNYMKNFGVQQFFTQKLKIVNPFLNNAVYSVPSSWQPVASCQIFPKGGNLVEGIKSTVGCRFTDLNGKGARVIARVRDMNNNTITSFRTYKNGFASFEITPLAGANYYIEALSDTIKLVTPLPKPLRSGLTFSVDTLTAELLRIKITSTDNTNFPVKLDAWHGGFVYPLTDTLINTAGLYEISTRRIPVGLINLELINSEGKSLANRLIYLNPFEKFKIDLKTDRESYGSREKVEVIISTRNNEGLPVKTNLILLSGLSQNVYKENDKAYPDAGLMGQELKQIYFSDNDLIVNACSDKKLLDLILLSTHMPFQKSSGANTLKYLPEIDGDIISGRLVYNDNQPANGIEVVQSFTGKTSWIESSKTDINGNFYFLTNMKNNKGDLILKVQNADRQISIIPDDEFSGDFPPANREILRLTEDEIELISKQFINIQVDDAFSVEKKDKTGKTDQEGYAFYGKEYVEYKFPDYLKLPNMKEFIFEVIEGVILSKENKKELIDILEESTLKKIGPHPLIIIDGVPVTESSIVTELPSEKVQNIRVVRHKYFYKDQIFDGILDISTYSQDASSFVLPRGTFRYNFIHSNEENIIIEPGFSLDNVGRIPLYKNLLYWNPNVTTDKDGLARISFYTPDNTGTFIIRCFGLTPEGLAGSGSVVIRVGKF